MRGLEKSYMKRGQPRNKEIKKHTSRLLDQLGPEGRVGENPKIQKKSKKKIWKFVFLKKKYLSSPVQTFSSTKISKIL